jgi:hypothetical protein
VAESSSILIGFVDGNRDRILLTDFFSLVPIIILLRMMLELPPTLGIGLIPLLTMTLREQPIWPEIITVVAIITVVEEAAEKEEETPMLRLRIDRRFQLIGGRERVHLAPTQSSNRAMPDYSTSV